MKLFLLLTKIKFTREKLFSLRFCYSIRTPQWCHSCFEPSTTLLPQQTTIVFYSSWQLFESPRIRTIEQQLCSKPLLWTTANVSPLRNVCYDFKWTIEWPEQLLITMLISIQAIQTKTKAVSDLSRYQLANRSNYELKSLSIIWKFKASTESKKQITQMWQQWNLSQVCTNSLPSVTTLN